MDDDLDQRRRQPLERVPARRRAQHEPRRRRRRAAWRSCRRPTPSRKCASAPTPTTPSSAAPAAASSPSASAAARTRFRGTAYYNHRDASLNSNLYENTVRGIPEGGSVPLQPRLHVRRPGACCRSTTAATRRSSSMRSKGLKSGIPVSSGERAPTDLERAGDFSQSGVTIYDPLNTVNGVPQPFPGNRIPPNRIDPVARNLMQYMVSPNSTPDAHAATTSSRASNSRFDTYTSGITRVDHNFGANHRFFARYGHNGRRETRAKSGREEVALTAGYHHRWNNVFSVDLSSTLSADACSRARAPAGRVTAGSTSAAPRTWAASIRRSSASRRSFTSAMPPRFPPIRINDYGGASIGQGGGQDGPSDDFYVQETLTKIARPPSAEVRRRVPLRHQHGREPARRRQLREPAVLAQLHVAAAERRHPHGGRRRQRVRVVPARLHGVEQRHGQPDLRLAQQLHRRVRAGRLAAHEPPDPERRAAVGLRGADHRDRRTRSTAGSTRTRSRSSAPRARRRACRRTCTAA